MRYLGNRMTLNRRAFLQCATAAALSAATGDTPEFHTANTRWQAAYDKALAILSGNVRVLPRYDKPVLIEGANYAGIWMECGPHEALVYRKFRPDVARNSHLVFFELQRPDGQIPANNKLSETGFGQIQMVVPIAATAWELAHATGDDELLRTAYRACSAWDGWLMSKRKLAAPGLIEGFCTYDTGHDNSPRWAGIPPQCPNKDAQQVSADPRPAAALSRPFRHCVRSAARRRRDGESAREIRRSGPLDGKRAQDSQPHSGAPLYVAEDAAFYDLDAQNRFVKIRCDILSRMCSEHIPDQTLFEDLWNRQIHNEKGVLGGLIPCPPWRLTTRCSSGRSRAIRGAAPPKRSLHCAPAAGSITTDVPPSSPIMMNRWCDAIQADMTFRQQMDPVNGEFSKEDNGNYSPARLVFLDYTWRLVGVREEGNALEWNVRPDHPAAQDATFRVRTDKGSTAEMRYDRRGAELQLAGKSLGRIDGGATRLVTDGSGIPKALVGIDEKTQKVTVRLAGRPSREIVVLSNQRVAL